MSSWEPNKRWRAVIEDECNKDPNVVEIRRANADYSHSILTWDERHIRAIRMLDSSTSYGYQNSANDEFIDRPDSSQVAEGAEPKIFLATQGLMGFVPPQARPGDMIYSFWECTVGFVVRKVADDRCMIVGRADLSRETLPGILDKDYFTDSLNYGTEKESYPWRKGTDYYRDSRQEAFENMLKFKLDVSTLQQLTA